MSQFGRTLFGASGFIRWTLTPFVLIFAVFMPLLLDEWTPTRISLMAGMELICAALLAGFWLPPRFGRWAFRIVAALVFLAYSAYLIHELAFGNRSLSTSTNGASPLRAVMGFVVIGIPSLWFALKGRFSVAAPPAPEQLAAERAAYEERVLHPNWEFYEKHLQRKVPEALRQLYADRALLLGETEWSPDHGLSAFEGLNENNLQACRDQLGFDVVAFATSDCGDPIYLRPGAHQSNTVYITYHDDNGREEVFADSVDDLIRKLRPAQTRV